VILLIDNYDSFTFNLVQRIGELDPAIDLRVIRNDKVTPDEVETMDGGAPPERIIISPGPCSPNEAGVSNAIVERFSGRVPIFGVCLGHQCIGFTSGMPVVRHSRIMHGKTSPVFHDGRGIFEGLSNPFTATRYHSLVVDVAQGAPEGWEISAWSDEPAEGDLPARKVVMGLRRITPPGRPTVDGVQFHPESFMTSEGPLILANFLGLPRPDAAALRP
jgi:anthranilate synthase/aminodeoxychorismate synthase-like glutamine amidotransferase